MLNYIIPLIASFLDIAWVRFWFFPLIALMFLSIIPVIIRKFITWR